MAASLNLKGAQFTSNTPNPTSNVVPAQAIDSSSNPNLVATITLPGNSGLLAVTGVVGGVGPLNGLKLTSAVISGGTHATLYNGSDFNIVSSRRLQDCTLNPHTTASGSAFQFILDVAGIQELKIYAASAAGATVALELSF